MSLSPEGLLEEATFFFFGLANLLRSIICPVSLGPLSVFDLALNTSFSVGFAATTSGSGILFSFSTLSSFILSFLTGLLTSIFPICFGPVIEPFALITSLEAAGLIGLDSSVLGAVFWIDPSLDTSFLESDLTCFSTIVSVSSLGDLTSEAVSFLGDSTLAAFFKSFLDGFFGSIVILPTVLGPVKSALAFITSLSVEFLTAAIFIASFSSLRA